MAEKIIKTRLLLKQDTLANWNNSTLPLKKGEVVFATTAASTTSGAAEPVVVAKVCTEDGKTFSELPYAFYAKAADVYDWAKKEAIEFTKQGTGNVVSDLSFADGKITYTTASVATSEGLAAIQQEIADNKEAWAKDTTYGFKVADGKLVITPSEGAATTLDIVTPEELTEAINAAKPTVATGDKVLAVADNAISSTLNLAYSSVDKKIKLTGIADVLIAEVDATDFIKDGMVDTASFNPETKKLTITFNTVSGKDPVEVDLASLVDTYIAGNGIAITGNSVAIKLDTASEAFLSVSSSGLKLSGIQAAINAAKTAANTYADSLATNYATAAQGTKADSALQSIAAGVGLTVSAKSGNAQTISIDDSITFIFDCGGAD